MLFLTDGTKPLRGVFSMRVISRDGTVISEYRDDNMIVNLARTAMAKLISEGAANKVITKFGVGTGAEVATPADTNLTNLYTNSITGHEFPDAGVVKFLWRLGYDEANHMDICEFGLFCEDGSLFSRKVRESIYKAEDIAFEGEWSIIF